MASSYLTRTVTASSATSYTVSFWIKINYPNWSNSPYLFTVGSTAGNGLYLAPADKKIKFFRIDDSAELTLYDGKLQDVNAWYHIVWSVNSGTGTAYVNGITGNSHSSIPALNNNSGTKINIHAYSNDGYNDLDCCMAHFHFIDGTAYDASTFGETDATTGIWKAKTEPSVTYGTNGFFLKFENSGSMGLDSSGNTNNFTVNGSVTQTVDTPSNVFATLNPLMLYPASTVLANGNTSCSTSSGSSHAYSTLAVSTGKWYWEAKLLSSNNNYFNVGIMDVSNPIISGSPYPLESSSNAYLYTHSGLISQSGGSTLLNTGTTISVNDIVGFYLDLDNGTLKLQKNGSNVYSGNAVITGLSSDITWVVAQGATTSSVQFNFGNGYFGTTAVSSANNDAGGQGIFEYSPTLSGVNYYALCTKNLATYG